MEGEKEAGIDLSAIRDTAEGDMIIVEVEGLSTDMMFCTIKRSIDHLVDLMVEIAFTITEEGKTEGDPLIVL